MSAILKFLNEWPAFVGFVLAAWALWIYATVRISRRLKQRAQVKRWKAAWRQAQNQGRPTIILETPVTRNAPPYPFPTTPEGWNALLSRTETVSRFFTPESQRRGLTAQFLDAYSKQYVTKHYPSDTRAENPMVNLGPTSPLCVHENAVPVETLDGETVAALCPDCGEQVGAEYAPKEQS